MRKLLIIILSVCFILQPIISQASMLFSSGGQQVVYRGTVTGLRISSADGVAFLDNIDITAEEANGKVVASGSVTQANMRISGIDGTAFIDTADATFAANITGNLGKYLVIKDSTGKKIKGWIKAAGTGETLGSELVDTWTNNSTYPFETFILGVGSLVDSAINTTGWDIAYKAVTMTNILIKNVNAITVNSGSNPVIAIAGSSSADYLIYFSINNTSYRTAKHTIGGSTHFVLLAPTQTNFSLTEYSSKQVLTPSTSGVTITNTKGGTTYNWYSKETGFNYNDSSNYTYQVIDRSLSAFADGNYGIEVYDASGRMLKGVAKAVGTEETLDTDVMAGFDFTSGWTATSGATINDSNTFTTTTNSSVTNDPGSHAATVNALYKSSLTVSSTATSVGLWQVAMVQQYNGVANFSGKYFTVGDARIQLRNVGAGTTDVTAFTMQQVLTPSTAGATIVSAKGGTTYNWQFKHASFTYNQSTNYVILKKLR